MLVQLHQAAGQIFLVSTDDSDRWTLVEVSETIQKQR